MGNQAAVQTVLASEPNEAMKHFVVLESFMGSVHFFAAISLIANVIIPISRLNQEEKGDSDALLQVIKITCIIWTAMLFLQMIVGIFLLRFGFIKRNVKVCVIWMAIAGINYFLLYVVVVMNIILDLWKKWKAPGSIYSLPFFNFLFMYLGYNGFAILKVNAYKNWVKASGIVGQNLLAIAPEAGPSPPSPAHSEESRQSHHGHHVWEDV